MKMQRIANRKSMRVTTLAAWALPMVLMSMVGCSGTSSSSSSPKGFVAILPGPTQVGTGGSLQVYAEASPAQVTWAITGGTGCSGNGCGTLNTPTATSVQYLGPASISGTTATFTLTATSTIDSSLQASQTYTIFPVGVQITGPTNTTVQPLTSASFTAVVNGDPTGNGVSWSVSGANCSGVGLAFTNCGTLTHATSSSVTYTAPAAPAQETILLTATSVAFPGTSAIYTITVPKLTVYQYTPTSLPPAVVGQAYTATVAITGNTPPYTVTATNLPSWAAFTFSAITNSFTITGTPTTGSQGSTQVLVSTSDSSTPVASGSKDFTLTVYPAQATGNNLLTGSYAFYGAGWLDGTLGNGSTSDQSISYIGSFTADGNGNIIGGELDTNNFQTGLTSFTTLTGSYNIQYATTTNPTTHVVTQNANFQTGYITLQPPGNERPITLAVSLRGIQHAMTPALTTDLATAGDFIEFDDTTGDGANLSGNSSGQRMTGTIALQSTSVLSQATSPLQGAFAFGMAGNTSQAITTSNTCFSTAPPTCGPISLAGMFSISSTGAISGGEQDIMLASNYLAATPGSLTGSFTNNGATDANGRMTASIANSTIAGAGNTFAGWPSNFIAYAIDSQHFYIMSSNSNQTFSEVIGTATQQLPTVATLPINTAQQLALYSSVVSTQYFTGGTGPNGKVRSQVQLFTATLAASGCTSTQYGLQGANYQNLSGTVTTATVGSEGNYCNTVGANGRVQPATTSTGEAEPIIYLTDTNTGYGTQWNAGSGPGLWFIRPQSGTSLLAGSYSDSMVTPTSIQAPQEVGIITVPTGGVSATSKTAVPVTGTIYTQASATNIEYSASPSMDSSVTLSGSSLNLNNEVYTSNGATYTGIFIKNSVILGPANSFQACTSGYGFVISPTSFVCIDTVDQYATPHLFQQ